MKDKIVVVVGSGGREHAFVDALSRSEQVEQIFCLPGNAGTTTQAHNVDIDVSDIPHIVDFAHNVEADLVVIGPEVPLSLGLTDALYKEQIPVFGPTQAAARIESSKHFAKTLMQKLNVPTAAYRTFTDYQAALAYTCQHSYPLVIKYDGLAAGKGVVIAQTEAEAKHALYDMLIDDVYGSAQVVIEEYLEGDEFSLFALVRGREVYPLQPAKDHKRAYENDEGPNTGGMGAFSPVPFVTTEDEDFVQQHILQPIADGLVEEGCPFVGLLYAGLIKTPTGIKVIEFNCRFGDPETEILLPRLQTDFYQLCATIAEGYRSDTNSLTPVPPLIWNNDYAVGFVLAAKGYPNSYKKGCPLTIPQELPEGVHIYHMGTTLNKDGQLINTGGRVLMVYALDQKASTARQKALHCIHQICNDHFFFRSDIGKSLP